MTQPAPGIPNEFYADPGFFPQKLDLARQLMLFVRLTREELTRASFLDDRILSAQSRGNWVDFDTVDRGVASGAPTLPLHFIFHAGHVGSTLLSRLLDQTGTVLGIREPLPLRTLAEAHDTLNTPESLMSAERFASLLRSQLFLWRRGYADTSTVVVKATSTTGRLAPTLLEALPSARAVYLSLDLDSYLAVLLAGENSIHDLRGHAPERIRRLHALSNTEPTPLHILGPGELAAMAWTVEKLTVKAAVAACGDRVLPLDFNAMLADVGATLRNVCAHFNIAAPDDYFTTASQSAAMQSYAKAPEAAYSPALRTQILQQARTQHADEIAKGKRWVDALAHRSPAVAALLT